MRPPSIWQLKKSIYPTNCQEMLSKELEVVSKSQIIFERPAS
jgi:transposase-like protein